MALTNLSDMMKSALNQLTESVDTGAVIGEPITVSEALTIVPVTKLTLGFVTGGAEIASTSEKMSESNTPVGAIGGGMTATPIGFLIVNKDGSASVLRADGNNGVEKWLDIVGNTVKDFLKKE